MALGYTVTSYSLGFPKKAPKQKKKKKIEGKPSLAMDGCRMMNLSVGWFPVGGGEHSIVFVPVQTGWVGC